MFRYLKDNFLGKDAHKWWKEYLYSSEVVVGLFHFLLFCAVLQAVFYWKPIIPLLAVFTISTISFAYGIFRGYKGIIKFVRTDEFPAEALTGYFIIGVGGLIFGSVILIPTFIHLTRALNAPVNVFSYLITYSYAISVWTFYRVMRTIRED